MKLHAKGGKRIARLLCIALSVMLIVTMIPIREIGRVYAEPNDDAQGTPAFSQQVKVAEDGIIIEVNAPEGVFPADARLEVSRITDEEDLAKAGKAADVQRKKASAPDYSYFFDIKVLDSDSNELQPLNTQDGEGVTVSFSKESDENLDADIYQIVKPDENTEISEEPDWEAVKCDVERDPETNVFQVHPYSFSAFAVDLTIEEKADEQKENEPEAAEPETKKAAKAPMLGAGGAAKAAPGSDPFSEYWNEEKQQYSLPSGTYTLTEDCQLNGRIYIGTNAEVTIDLGGKTLSGNTGGEQINYGGVIGNYGTLTVKNGTITGGKAQYGGGIFNFDSGVLNVEDVTITGNEATKNGGGIYSDAGDGDDESKVTISGATITRNTAGEKGGGIYCDGTLNMSGKVIVEENDSTNLYLEAGRVINVTGAFEEGSSIGVTGIDYPCYLTSGLSASGNKSIEMFTLDNAPVGVNFVSAGGELYAKKTDTTVNSWAALQTAVNNAPDNTRTVIELSADCKASSSQDRIQIPEKKIIVLDLAGYTLNRNRTSSHKNGHVIEVFGKLTILDSSAKGTGAIRGGFATRGGGINVNQTGTCDLKGGTILGNKASTGGGGVYVHGIFKMSGGAIKTNETTGSGADGGGIYVDGDDKATLEITGGTIASNTTDTDDDKGEAGAGILVKSGANVSISNATFDDNWSREEGAAIYTEASIDIDNCTFKFNHTVAIASTKEEYDPINHYYYYRLDDTYDGGAIYINGSSAVVNIKDSKFTDNYITNYALQNNHGNGGAIYLNKGTLNISDSSFHNNKSWEGGAIYSKSGTTVSAENTTFSGNNLGITKRYSDDQAPKKIPIGSYGGGAIASYGTLTLDGCTFTDNYLTDDPNERTGTAKGGAVYSKGKLSMKDVTFTGNKARFGGAIYLDDGQVDLNGCTMKDNSASSEGGGIYVGTGKTFNVKGDVEISDNSASRGGDVYLPSGKFITLNGSLGLNSSNIGVSLEKKEGQFTRNFSQHHDGKIPEAYFYSADGYEVILKDNEGYIQKGTLDTSGKFINWKDQINTNAKRLTGPNWMSGVSGERYLNEINIPGTHDTSMNNVSAKGCLSGDIGASQAKTQREYLNEQLEHGARFFDIRMKTKYCSGEVHIGGIGLGVSVPLFFIPVVGIPLGSIIATASTLMLINGSVLPKYKDDGKNLWTCHGRSAAGTFYALNKDGDNLSVSEELEMMKEFLTEHPTETIIIDARPETDEKGGEEFYGPLERFKGILEELSKEKNPSTGESFVYWEDGNVCERYKHWPQLKDCRGKILFYSEKGENVVNVIGGLCKGVDGIESECAEGTYQDGTSRAKHLKEFIKSHEGAKIPRNALEGQMKEFYWLKMNTTDTSFMYTPVQLAEQYVLPTVFGSNGLVNESKKGTYFGWFSMDAARASHCRDVWITNFPSDLEYCRVTVKSSPSDPNPQRYQLLKGTKITIPGCIYEGTKADNFVGWEADIDGKTYTMNSTYTIDENVTFTAQWSDQMKTPVTVVWKDADDLDGARPKTLTIGYNTGNGEKPATVDSSQKWMVTLTGNLSDDPVVKDIPEEYTAKVEGQKGKDGYTITMTHSPDVEVHAAGTVTWEDQDDVDEVRPESVTLELYKNGGETPIATGTASASNGWTFDLGTFDRYEDGELVAYRLVEKEIDVKDEYCTGYTNYVEAISGEKNAITGFNVTNTHEVETSVIYARIEWDDDNNAAGKRPESVTVQWKKNGESYGDPIEVKPNEDGQWIAGLEITYAEMKAIGERQKEIVQKYKDGEITEEEFLNQMEGTMAYTIEQDSVEGYTTTVMLKDGEETENSSQSSYYEIRNTYNKPIDPDKPKHKLTFYEDTAGKVTWKEMTLEEGEELERFADYGTYEPDLLEKEGYTFAGWATEKNIDIHYYRDKNGKLNSQLEGKLVDWTAPISKDMEVYPIWIADRIVVSIVPKTDDSDDVVDINDEQSLGFITDLNEKIAMRNLVNASRVGYTLDGWYTKNGKLWNGENWKDLNYVSEGWDETEGWGVTPEYCDNDEDGNPVIRFNNDRKFNYRILTLTARWTPKKVAVKYDLGAYSAEGAVPTDGEVTLGNTVTLAEAPEAASGAVFEGWKAPDGTLYSAGDPFLFKDWKHQQDNPDAETPTITMTAQYHVHNFTKIEAKAATCTKDGNIEYWICDGGEHPCGRYFADPKGEKEINKEDTVIKATGHDWGKWSKFDSKQHQRICANDGGHVQKQDHIWNAGEVTRKATDKHDGVMTYTCTVCEATKTKSIPAKKTSKTKGVLAVKMKAKGNTSIVISWNKVDGAEGYDLFFSRCNGKSRSSMKKLKTLKGNGSLSWTVKGLKKYKGYKAYVKAWKMKDGKKTYVKTSLTFHAFASGVSKKNYTNPKSVKVNQKKVTLKQGKTFKIKAKVTKLKKKRKLISKKHAPKLRYQSSDKKVATVSSSGRIKARSKGTCRIYGYAANGVYKTVRVTVK